MAATSGACFALAAKRKALIRSTRSLMRPKSALTRSAAAKFSARSATLKVARRSTTTLSLVVYTLPALVMRTV